MSEQETSVPAADEEAALDAQIAADIAQVQAGQTLEAQPQGQTGESGAIGEATPTGETGPTGATGATGEGDGNLQPTGATGEEELLRVPNKGKWESDDAYEKRVELFDLANKRRAATTPEAREALTVKINGIKESLKTTGSIAERFTQPKVESTPTGASGETGATGEADPNLIADQERLKQLGGATKEEVAEIIRQERLAQDVQTSLQRFVGENPELKDPEVRDLFFDFVESNYNWQGKSGRELEAVLDMARENYFRPSETMENRVLKGASVAEKVNAMQFPGGTGAKTTYSPEMQKSIDELKATGMPEDKAIELLTE